MTSKFKRTLVDFSSYIWGIIVFVFLLVVTLGLYKSNYVTLKTDVDLLTLTGIPLFVITILCLAKSYRVQAAALVRSHISEFISNQELYSAFYELIYAYEDDIWIKVEKALPSNLNRKERNKTPEMKAASWRALESINGSKAEGKRYFDPDFFGSLGIRMVNGFRQVAVHCKNNGMYTARRWSPCEFPENHFFQGSIEEQRLDAVLHYFDMLAYNQQRNLISAEDISGVSGYHLAVIGSRDIINYYLDQIKNNWEYLPYKKRISAEEPFDNLRKLLADVKRINEKKFRENKVEEK